MCEDVWAYNDMFHIILFSIQYYEYFILKPFQVF